MRLIDLTCTKCGAELRVNPELTKCMCQYCGNEMLIDDEVIHHKIDNGFDFGYEAELGRQRFKETLAKIDHNIEAARRMVTECENSINKSKGIIVITIVFLLIANWIALEMK